MTWASVSWRAVLGLALSAGLWTAAPRAQDLVWDPFEIAKITEEAAQMSEAILATVELLNQTNALVSTVGRSGALSSLDFTRFDASGSLAGLVPPPPSPGAQPATGLRKAAAENGYALALHIRQNLAAAPLNGQVLASSAAASADLRGDLTADSAAALTGLDQLIGLRALLATLLEIRASEQFRLGQPGSPPSSLQQGKAQP